MDKKFIRSTDPETIKKLKELNFQLVSEVNGVATFINDVTKPITFEKKKMAYTNRLVV